MVIKMKNCRVCFKEIDTDRFGKVDVHPDCELKERFERIHNATRFDGTGQDEECMMEEEGW